MHLRRQIRYQQGAPTLLIAAYAAIFSLVWLFSTPAALACGPGFPMALSVQAGLQYLPPSDDFAKQVDAMLPVPEQALPVDPRLHREQDSFGNFAQAAAREREAVEYYADAGLRAQLSAARAAATAALAYAAAADLPADHRYYVAGAVAFKHAAYADAQAYFAKSLALGSFERPFRAMALFMLGQTATKAAQPVQAARYFQALRAAVEPNNSTLGSKSGGVQVDPLGLALSSLGAEAKLHLQALKDNSYPGAKIAVPRMIKLYLAQTAQERLQSNSLIQLPGSGFVSLRLALRYLRTHPEQLEAGLADPWVQQVLVAYLVSRKDYVTPIYDDAENNDQSDSNEDGGYDIRAPRRPAVDATLTALLLRAVAKTGQKSLRGADNFAYLLYESGSFDDAEKFAQLSNGTKAIWVRARLAERAGREDEAARLYLAVRQRYESTEPPDSPWNREADEARQQCAYIDAERGIVAFNRGEFGRAIELFADEYNSAYIAERIMSRQQLRAYVDNASKQGGDALLSPSVTMSKRILGKRYLRAGRLDLAETYLGANSDEHKFIEASRAVELASGIPKAQRLYELAITLRKASYNGEYDLAPVLPISVDSYDQGRAFDGDASYTKNYAKRQPSADEQAPGQRFSARFRAVAIALQAADELPRRSQSFAAVLCQASHWAMPKDPTRGRAIYQRYVRDGAFQAWAKDFGTNRCPVPNFALAQYQLHLTLLKQKLRAIRKVILN